MSKSSADSICNLQLSRLWVVLVLSLLIPPIVAVAWGNAYTDTVYQGLQQAQAIAMGQGLDLRFSPLFTLLLALADYLRLPLPPVAVALSVIGWMVAIAAWFLTGLVLERPTFSAAVAILLALHPQQDRALGLEPGLVLGLLGLTAWCVVQGRARTALVTTLALAAAQPLALLLVLPLFIYFRLRKPSAPTNLSFVICHLSFVTGIVCYGLVCILTGSWAEPRRTVPLLAALDILAASGFASLVPDFDWLTSPAVEKYTLTLKRGFLVLVFAALAVWQGNRLAQDWRFRPTDRRELYEKVAQWLRDHTLPTETVATQQIGLLGYLSRRTTVPLPGASSVTSLLITAIDRARPDYCIALNSLTWSGVRAQPWFQERYEKVYQVASPYDMATPLTVFRYTPTPFDDGETISTMAIFALDVVGQVELTGYRLDSRRITPDEPLHLTLYWRAVTSVHEPLLLTVRLADPATGRVWAQVENLAPGGLATNLWNAETRLDDRYTLVPPADIPPGDYILDVAFRLSNGRPLPIYVGGERLPSPSRGGDEGAVGARCAFAQVNRPPNVSTVPLTPDHPFSATFGSEIELVGYDVKGRIAPGESLRVALYWHSVQHVLLDYKVFVHLLAPGDILLAQDDSQPVGWRYPTTRWQPGETIRDEHLLTVSPSAPRGDYWLVAGLYNPATGQRPVVYDVAGNEIAERRVLLQRIQVR